MRMETHSPSETFAIPGDVSLSPLGEPLLESGWRPEMLLNLLQGTRQPLTKNNHLLQSVNSVVTAVLATVLSCLCATSMVWEEARSAVHPPE